MSRFNISSFLKAMTGVVKGYEKQGAIGVYLLSVIGDFEFVKVKVTEKMISNLVNQKTEVHEDIY